MRREDGGVVHWEREAMTVPVERQTVRVNVAIA